MTQTAVAISKPTSSRWASGRVWAQPGGGASLLKPPGTGKASTALSFQGYLSDLLKGVNWPYDKPKLQDYTQIIISGTSSQGITVLPGQGKSLPGVSAPPSGWEGEKEVMGDWVLLVFWQLQMVDMNSNRKLGLSEMSQ